MAKVKIEITGEIELHYDENSKEFKEALEGYCDLIDPVGEIEDMLKHVAFSVTEFGLNKMVEGVGYVGYGNGVETNQPFSGITAVQSPLEFNCDLQQSERS